MEQYPTKRRYRLGETKYVAEILERFYPETIHIMPCRLGTSPTPFGEEELTEEELRMLEVRMRIADAVVITQDKIIVIEGKLLPARYPEGLTKLEIYLPLVIHTLRLQEFLPRTIEGELWTPLSDPMVRRRCAEKGIRNPIWSPPWFKEFLTSWAPRSRRPPRYE